MMSRHSGLLKRPFRQGAEASRRDACATQTPAGERYTISFSCAFCVVMINCLNATAGRFFWFGGKNPDRRRIDACDPGYAGGKVRRSLGAGRDLELQATPF